MLRETIIDEFLTRLESAIDAEVEPCDCEIVVENIVNDLIDEVKLTDAQKISIRRHSAECDAAATPTLDKQAALAALDRLFLDLKDFVKEPAKVKKTVKRKGK